MLGSLRFTVLVVALALAITPASIASATSCIDPTSCLCGLQRGDSIATLAVTVVAVGKDATQVRIDDVRPFEGQTTALTAGDLRDAAPTENAVGEHYLALLRHCVPCDDCYDYGCNECEFCENGTDRVSLFQQAGTDGIPCGEGDDKAWFPLSTALDVSVSPTCRREVNARLEEVGADSDCGGFLFCDASPARGDGWQGFALAALVTAGLFRRRVARRAL